MESNKNNNNNNGGDEQQQQLQKSARKRKLNELVNDDKPGGKEEDQQEQEDSTIKNSRRDGRNDQDLQQIVQVPHVTAQVQVTGTGEKETADENEEQAEEEAEVPILPPMKIEISKETWFDMLEFVGRRQLGQLVPQVGDRRFAGIVQSFLHGYGCITVANICITGPDHRLIQHVVEMPENVKDFLFISLSYLTTPVINLLQKFKQNFLLGNVNLDLRLQKALWGIDNTPNAQWNRLLKTLSHLLPAIDNINSIRSEKIAQLAALYNANSEMAMAMLKMARFIDIFHDDFKFAPDEIAFLNRWLHTPRDDGKPRVLILPVEYSEFLSIDKIPHFIDGTIKLEFAAAKVPVCFFIRLFVPNKIDWHDSSMENGETREKLVIKKVATIGIGPTNTNGQKMALISRYSMGAGNRWIEANEREAINWDFDEQNGRICLGDSVRNAIDNGDDDNNADGDDGQDDQRGSRPNSNYGDRDRAFGDRRRMGRAMGFARRGGYQGMSIHLMVGGHCIVRPASVWRGGEGRGGGPGRGGFQGRGGAGGQGRGGGRGRGEEGRA